jgi:thiosulfate reductase cytochrome b subunit
MAEQDLRPYESSLSESSLIDDRPDERFGEDEEDSEHPAFAGLPLHADELTAEIAADAAARHAIGEVMPIVGAPAAEPEADNAEADAAWETTEEEQAEEVAGGAAIAQPPSAAVEHLDPKKPIEPPDAAEPLRLERKHPLAIRWMHWINFPVLFTMIWSGLLIYWNDSDNAYLHPHAVYRVALGPVTILRFFPAWFYTNPLWDMRYHVTQGLGYHFFFMWLFAANGILYVAYLLWSREWKFMVPDLRRLRQVLTDAVKVALIDARLLPGPLPPQTKYNAAQKIAYTSVIAMGFGSLVTGLAIYKPTSAHPLTQLLGGYEMARWFHFWLTMGFCAFFLVHVYQVAAAGWNNFRAMVTGYELRRLGEPSLEAERSRF